ncbi:MULTISPECIES: beta-xylosidase [unclassified Rhodococcus (in: high G+C Gram-positive bacteria)]|uniref:beta-xylosidase n=1 Tax=unclassified Rhodococcus (in: high G+C Gram-positive bacteria) TaxID=192944 RepID=UPI001F373DA7|nr:MULTISPECIES: beta-xylosidase [unclassified Rhodococcus (in: high G+C Gram-positive bacteria)]
MPIPASGAPSGEVPRCVAESDGVRVGGSPGGSFGFLSDEDLGSELDIARDAGMFSVRIDIDWSVVEPRPGRRDWASTDRIVDAIVARGMCPYAIVTYAPPWARVATAVDQPYARPASPDAFAAFGALAAERYRDRISLWEVWNEPNITTYFAPRPDPTVYALMLRATYRAIKAVQPEALVLSGGMAPAVDNGINISPKTFLTQMNSLGANRYFDAFNVHPYTWPFLPNDLSTAQWNTAMAMWPMHDIMAGAGDGEKQIWITEIGAPTGTNANAMSADGQAESIAIMMNALLGNDWLGPAYVYSIRDSGTDLGDTEQNFGIVERDFTPKPALSRITEFTAEHSTS